MRVPDCFNVIVVEEAPYHGRHHGRHRLSHSEDIHGDRTQGRRRRRAALLLWSSLTEAECSLCLSGSHSYRHPTRMTRLTYSVTVATLCEVRGSGMSFYLLLLPLQAQARESHRLLW